MEEIKVGEYIYNRYNGEISKYKKIDDKRYIDTKTSFVLDIDKHMLLGKVSKNIIDLIEVRDYVNGYKVNDIGSDYIMCEDYEIAISESEIETIVTKEQFSQMEYRLED